MANSDLIQSLTRGLVVLELLAEADDALTLSSISERMQLGASTVHNLLRTLMARGFVEKLTCPTRYRLGSSAAHLANQWNRRGLLKRVEKAMVDLHTAFPEARLSFAQAIENNVVVTYRLGPEMPGKMQRGAERPMSPYGSASALLYQALWPAQVSEDYRKRNPFNEYGGYVWESVAALNNYLQKVRRAGFACPHFDGETNFRIAAPVLDFGNSLSGALGAYIPDIEQSAVNTKALQHALVQAAAKVSRNELEQSA